MVLCVAILLLQGNNKYTPLIVEQRGVMTKKVAFENIYQVIPHINNVNNNNSNNKHMYGSLILNDSNDLHLFHGHYRIILNNAVALVAISESNDNPFESHRLLEKVQNMVEQSYINMSNKKDFKLPTQKRIEKLHGELLLLLKRLLLRFDDVHGSNFITAKNNGMLGLDLSSEKKISNKRGSTSLRKGANDATDVGHVWKNMRLSTSNNINVLYGDDPAHDVFQINFAHQFSKRKVIAANTNINNDMQKNIFIAEDVELKKKISAIDESQWKLTTEDAKKYINTTFVNLKDEKTGICSGKKAFRFFKNKITEKELLKIYRLCNISIDESFTPRKFGVLLHIIVLISVRKPPLQMPQVLPHNLGKILSK